MHYGETILVADVTASNLTVLKSPRNLLPNNYISYLDMVENQPCKDRKPYHVFTHGDLRPKLTTNFTDLT